MSPRIPAVGELCYVPSSLLPSLPWLFTVIDGLFGGPSALIAPAPAPWSVTIPLGLPFSVEFTLQGMIEHDSTGIPLTDLAVTNAIILEIQ